MTTSGFQQQNPTHTAPMPKSEPLPQHGQKPDKSCIKPQPKTREVKARPGH